MRKCTCSACKTVFLVGDEGGALSCPGCQKAYQVPPKAAPGPAPDQAAASAAPSSEPAVSPATEPAPALPHAAPPPPPPALPKQTSRPVTAPPQPASGALGLVLSSIGILFICAAFIIWCFSPLRSAPSQSPQYAQALEELTAEYRELQRQLAQERAQVQQLSATLAAEQRRELELQERDGELDRSLAQAAANAAQSLAALGQAQPNSSPSMPPPATVKVETEAPQDAVSILARAEKTVLIVRTDCGSGSGFILHESGLAVTNYHVIEGSSELSVAVQQKDSREQCTLTASVIAVDPERDMALLQLPPAPATVGPDGKYPWVELREQLPAQTGENVFAIGNPGMGQVILDYTVSKGIVSNPDRQVEARAMIQISVPVNPGNSGGPLFDAQGRCLGIITAKGVNVEAISFAVPVRELGDLLKRQKEEGFAVKDSLEEWEKVHRPLAVLQRRYRQLSATPLVNLDAQITALVLSPSGRNAYLVLGLAGRVVEFDVRDRKIGREYRAECVLSDACWGWVDEHLLLTAPETQKVIRLNVRTMSNNGEVVVLSRPVALTPLTGSDLFTVLDSNGGTWIASRNSFGNATASPYRLPLELPGAMLGINGGSRWLAFVSASHHSTTCRISIFPSAPLASELNLLQRLEKSSRVQFHQVRERAQRAAKIFDISGMVLSREGKITERLLWCGNTDKFIFARRMFKIGAQIECEGTFASSALASSENPGVRAHREVFQFLDNIGAVSPDGRYATSALSVYQTGTRQIVRQLPFPATVQAFTPDGKGLYLTGKAEGSLYLFPDWLTALPPPEK